MADHGPVPLRLVPLPPGVPEGIQVWHLPLCLERPAPDRDWALLSPAEVERAARLRQPADRVRSVCTRAALRRLLGEWLGIPASQVPLAVGPHGRPRLGADTEGDGQGRGDAPGWDADGGPDFNISHSGECALIALADGGLSVGVDVEWRCVGTSPSAMPVRSGPLPPGGSPAATVASDEDARALESLVLSPREQAVCAAMRPAFNTLWTAKEAVLKCLGVGVAEHLRDVSLEWPGAHMPGLVRGTAADAGGPVTVLLEGRLAGRAAVQACRLQLALPGHHAAALAWSSDLRWSHRGGHATGTPLATTWAGALDLPRPTPPSQRPGMPDGG
jgi:4'-phosphopantetheinyl transferase